MPLASFPALYSSSSKPLLSLHVASLQLAFSYMASRMRGSLLGRAASHLSSRRSLAWGSVRFYNSPNASAPAPASSPKSLTEGEAKSRASELLSYVPGSTPLAKTTWLTVCGSLAAILAANDAYIPNHETPVLAAFVVLIRILYVKLGPAVSEFAEKGIQELRTVWTSRLHGERQGYVDALDHLCKFRSYRQVNDAYLSTRRENAAMEAELDACLKINKHLHDIKMTIEERVRAASEARLAEKKALLASLLDRVMADLKDPRVQESIMRQCLADIDVIAAAQGKK